MSNKVIYQFKMSRTKEDDKHRLEIDVCATVTELKKIRKHLIKDLNVIQQDIDEA